MFGFVPENSSFPVKVTYVPKAGAVAGPFEDTIWIGTDCGGMKTFCIIIGILVEDEKQGP
jgi:hypothetical protein